MDTESVLIALALFALMGLGYKHLRRSRRQPGETPPEHFFGAMDEETQLPPR